MLFALQLGHRNDVPTSGVDGNLAWSSYGVDVEGRSVDDGRLEAGRRLGAGGLGDIIRPAGV